MDMTQKEQTLLESFSSLTSEIFYEKIMLMGRQLPPFPQDEKVQENKVVGCQSLMYCLVELTEGRLKLHVDSDALISKGLAALVVYLYDNLTPSQALSYRPKILTSLGFFASLSLTRLNGLESLLKHVLKKIVCIQANLIEEK